MHERKSEQGVQKRANDPAIESPPAGKVKPLEGKMPTVNQGLLQSNGSSPAMEGAKSAALRQCKSFNSKDSNLQVISKAPKSGHENSKASIKSNGALIKRDAPPSSVENGVKFAKFNGAAKPDVVTLPKPKQGKAGASLGRSEKVKSPGNVAGILKNSSSKVNVESQRKSIKLDYYPKLSIADRSASSRVIHKAKETSPKPALAHVKSLSLSLNADPQKKLPPIKTARTSAKSASAKNTANLCAECKAEVEGAVCFIGNDGRVSACTSRNAVRLCKNLKCANNNPEYVASLAAAIAAPKKYLVSRRHSLNLPRSSTLPSNGKADPDTDKMDAQTLNDQNGSAAHESGDLAATLPQQEGGDDSDEFDVKGELEEDVTSLEDLSGEVVEIDGIASASPHGGRSGYQRMRRRSFSVIETQGPPAEVVTLRKQMMQERKQAEEWMLDYAIEEALHKLAPSKDSKVKALVEAYESIIPAAAAQDHQPEAKTPNKIAIKI